MGDTKQRDGSVERFRFGVTVALVVLGPLGYLWLFWLAISFVPALAVVPAVGLGLVLGGARALHSSHYIAAVVTLLLALAIVVVFSIAEQPPYWSPAGEAFGPDLSMPPIGDPLLIQLSWTAWHLLPWALVAGIVTALIGRRRSRQNSDATSA